MKILFVITGLGVGGAESQVIDLADRFAQRGATVVLAYLTGEPGILPRHSAIQVRGLGMTHSFAGMACGYRALRRLIRDYQPDVVHSHMVHANLLARLVRLTSKVPRLICTAHSTNEGGRLRMLAYRLTDRLGDLFTNVSGNAVAMFEAKGAAPKGRMLAVTNGIDTDRFRSDGAARQQLRAAAGLAVDTRLVLAVGRLAEAKDYPNLLRAFSSVDQGARKTVLWIAGAGALLPELQGLAAQLNLQDNVTFLGVRADTEALYNAADVFVLSSRWEGFGLVVAEAMASEKVVVATDCGGVLEVLGDCGLLVPPQNSERLAGALEQALAMGPAQSAGLGARARQRVLTRYSLQQTVATWEALYRRGRLPQEA